MEPFPAKSIPYLTKYVSQFKIPVLISFLLVLLGASISNLGNWFFSQIVETIKNGVSDTSLKQALTLITLMSACTITNIFIPKITFMYRQNNFYFPIEEKITKDAISYIQGHSVNYISSNQSGMFVNRLDQILSIQPIFSMILVSSWSIICEIVLKTIILITISPWLGLMFLVSTILSYFFNELVNKKSERLHKMNSRIEALYAGWLVDIIANIRFVKQFNKQSFEKNRFTTILAQWFNIKQKELKEGLAAYTYTGFYINTFSMILISFAVYLWSINKIGVGDIVFVLLTLTSGLNYLSELHEMIRNIRNKLSSIDEGLKPFSIPHEIKDAPSAKNLKIRKGEIKFQNVSFSYNNTKAVFDNFNLTINPKEKIGIVGASGSGKTTLINLLQRAYEPQNGQILIDGKNIAAITQNSLHENITIIPQETTLFHRSIKENILFGNPSASKQKVIDAAKKAHADEFIKNLYDGYNSEVGDRGCKLSGGEKQRIAIARAILKNSPILILDEATSSLDSESEHLISQAISRVIKNKTVIAIAHRLSTLKEMDRIIVMEKGKIVESGTFAELSQKTGGKFQLFYKLQKIKVNK